jgi:hypothetical protein
VIVLRIVVFVLGAALVLEMVASAIRTFVVPRGIPERLNRVVFIAMRRVFNLWISRVRSYAAKDRIMAFYAPYTLLSLPAVWLAFVLVGYAAMFWAAGVGSPETAIITSGSSLFTLGFAQVHTLFTALLAFSEAGIGLVLLALLIAYLPSMYAAFQRRETEVTLLESQAGSPPSPLTMLVRLHRIEELDRISEKWPLWQTWFADISESHTSLSALVFYRSPRPDRSWVTAAGAVLDTASIVSSSLDRPRDPEAELCIRTGYLALRQICDLFRIAYEPDPHYPADPISVKREEFDALYDALAEEGVALKPDRDKVWKDFAGWRVNYDAPLLALASITLAPLAPWSSDRAGPWRRHMFGPMAKKKAP